MDQRERISDLDEVLRTAQDDLRAHLWTALPGIVQSFNAAQCTCTVQPSVQARVRSAQGEFSWVSLPLLLDVPVVFPSGGGFTITFPVQQGDDCLVVFSSRCIDAWWQQGGVQQQIELRMHDLSDGFAFVGPFSVPSVPANISTANLQMRTVDGSAYLELTPSGALNIVAPAGVHVTGAVTASGEGTFNGGHTVSAHTHSDPQGGVTGTPTG